ncbi:MAG: class I SAM-dependent methyltransferase [Cyanobacteriota bacterium]|nr:class I SAM-dependent methyltransferase [Cyanobacteriota bacterium]
MQEDYKHKVIEFFNGRTAYDLEGDSHPIEAKRLLEYVAVRAGQTILDLATGTGLVAIPAAKAVAPKGSVIGVDISKGMLAQAKDKIVADAIDNLELIEADVESIDFNSEQFDLIFCCSALVYISDISAIIDKCYRWLKPESCLAFTTPDRSSYLADIRVEVCQNLLGIDLPHIIRPLWTPQKCHTLLKKSGFHNIEIEKHQYRRYKIDENYGSTRMEKEFYPRGNPLLSLSEAQKERLQAEYKKAVDQLIADRGVWQEAIHLYVKAWK